MTARKGFFCVVGSDVDGFDSLWIVDESEAACLRRIVYLRARYVMHTFRVWPSAEVGTKLRLRRVRYAEAGAL